MKKYFEVIVKDYIPCILRPYDKSNKNLLKRIPYLSLVFISYFLIFSLYTNSIAITTISKAFEKTIIFIISYFLVKELEPDMKQHYKTALILTFAGIIFMNSINIIGAFSVLLCARILSRSSGFKASIYELLLMLFLGVYLFFFSSSTYPFLIAATLIADFIKDSKQKKELPFIIPLITLSLIGFFRSLTYIEFLTRPTLLSSLVLAIITILFALRISLIKRILSPNDLGNKALSPSRIKALNGLILLSAFIESFVYGNVNEFIYVWMIALGISAPYLRDIKQILNIKKT